MKKIICALLSFSLAFAGFTFNNRLNYKVKASENKEIILEDVDWSDLGFSNVKITFRETTSLDSRNVLDDPKIEIDYIIDETDEKIHFERIGSVGYYYVNDSLFTLIQYGQNSRANITIPNSYYQLGYGHDSGWSHFSLVNYETWVVREIKNLGQSAIVSIFTTAITGGINTIANLATNVLSDLASSLYRGYQLSNKPEDVYAVNFEYASQYYQCNILYWYGLRVAMYNTTFTQVQNDAGFEENTRHYWYANPHDYTQPTACRLITSDYPY